MFCLYTSFVVAVTRPEDAHHAWAIAKFLECKTQGGPLLIPDMVYAEWCVGFDNQNSVDLLIREFGFQRYHAADSALFLASRAIIKYKKVNLGPKNLGLPDFFIGAAAVDAKVPLLTFNPKDFRNYFPSLTLLHP